MSRLNFPISVDGRRLSVCLSVRLSVRPVTRPKSKTERPRKPIVGAMEHHDPVNPLQSQKIKDQGHRANCS